MPTECSTSSSFVRRPAPSSSAATPTASAWTRVTTPSLGASSLILYLALGAAGLPVFTPLGLPGAARLIGPTGGYLLAYPVAAYAVAHRANFHGVVQRLIPAQKVKNIADKINATPQDFPEPVEPRTAKFFASNSSTSTKAWRVGS